MPSAEYSLPSNTRVAQTLDTVGSSTVKRVWYSCDDTDRKWLDAMRRKGNPWAMALVFERIFTELEVLSYRSQASARVHVAPSVWSSWISELGNLGTKDELGVMVKKSEEYWVEKRAVYPKLLRTGLIPELERTPEEADGNSGDGPNNIPLPFMRREKDREEWQMKPKEAKVPLPTKSEQQIGRAHV